MRKRTIRWILTLVLLFTNKFAFTQFSGPNASTYNPNTGKYYISNYYGKNVVSVDQNNNKATFITGLTAPNNLIYANLPVGSGYLILDSNEIKAYDDAGDFFASFGTSGAIKLQDLVFDTASQTLYTSDVERGVVYKTTFAPPPFYTPITSIFSSPYRRPSAMVLQKKLNRILYVEDTIGGNLMAINLSNGTSSKIKTLSMDYLVGLAEDGQGNLYLSSQGNKAIYQLNKYYAGTPKKLYSEPKPGDLLVNVEKDQWVYTCIACGTVFTPPLHIFGPGYEEDLCSGDTFPSYRNFLMNNIGTFDAGNQFIAELSNSSGSFSNPLFLTSIKDTLVPDSLLCVLPKFVSQGFGYKLRWRSTKPAIVGSKETVIVNALPKAGISVSDTIQGCYGSTVQLGQNNPSSGISYQWSPPQLVDSPQRYSCFLKLDSQVKIFLKATSSAGCIFRDSAWVLPVTLPNPGQLADTLNTCFGMPVALGAAAKGGLNYSWSPGQYLDDSTLAQPKYSDSIPRTFSLTVTAPGGCKNSVTQSILIHPLPIFNLVWDSIGLCAGNTALNSTIHKYTNYTCAWIDPNGDTTLGDSRGFDWNYIGPQGNTRVILTENMYGCTNSKEVSVSRYPLTNVNLNSNNFRLTPNVNLTHLQWFRNDTLIAADSNSFAINMSGKYKVCGKDTNQCEVCSPPNFYNANNIQNHNLAMCSIYPNPADNLLKLNCMENQTPYWEIFDVNGRMIKSGVALDIDISAVCNGMYFIKVKNQMPFPFVIHHK